MTSDEFFWRLVLATRTMDEAVLLWWLALVRADERPYIPPPRALELMYGLDRLRLSTATRSLKSRGLVSIKVKQSRFTQFTLTADSLRDAIGLGHPNTVGRFFPAYGFDPASLPTATTGSLGQSATARSNSPLLHFDPLTQVSYEGVAASKAYARLCIKRRNRGEAIVLAWLLQVGWSREWFTVSSRKLHALLGGLVDRRTMLRTLQRLADCGLVEVTDAGRDGMNYRLHQEACRDLLLTRPENADAARTLPGWSSVAFPLLAKLTLDAATSPELLDCGVQGEAYEPSSLAPTKSPSADTALLGEVNA